MAMNAKLGRRAIGALKVSGSCSYHSFVYSLTIGPQPVVLRSITAVPSRNYATSSEPDLKTTLREIIPAKRELLKKVRAHSDKVIGEIKIENTLGGMR